MPSLVIKSRRAQEVLRKNGKIYTVRVDNKREGDVTIYFGRHKVAKGVLRKVADYSGANLKSFAPLSGYGNEKRWRNMVDKVFLCTGITDYHNLAIYEVVVTEWLSNPFLCEE